MGERSAKQWSFDYWESGDSSPVQEQFEAFLSKGPSKRKMLRHKINDLREKALPSLLAPNLLEDLGNGLWGLEIAGGGAVYQFLGSIELVYGATYFVALSGHQHRSTKRERSEQEGLARVRLEVRRQNYQLVNLSVYYGLPPRE